MDNKIYLTFQRFLSNVMNRLHIRCFKSMELIVSDLNSFRFPLNCKGQIDKRRASHIDAAASRPVQNGKRNFLPNEL